MSRHDFLLLGSDLGTHSGSIIDFCLEDWRNTLVMGTFNEQEESCWVKMNHHSHFIAQRVLSEPLGTKLCGLARKTFPFGKRELLFRGAGIEGQEERGYVVNTQKSYPSEGSIACFSVFITLSSREAGTFWMAWHGMSKTWLAVCILWTN